MSGAGKGMCRKKASVWTGPGGAVLRQHHQLVIVDPDEIAGEEVRAVRSANAVDLRVGLQY